MPCAQQVARVQGQVCPQHPMTANPTRPQWLANGGTPSKTLLTLSKTLLTLLQKGLTSRGSSLGGA
jgi:hypothetical protein